MPIRTKHPDIGPGPKVPHASSWPGAVELHFDAVGTGRAEGEAVVVEVDVSIDPRPPGLSQSLRLPPTLLP